MSVTKQHFVERRMMGKQELAHLYFPHSKQKGHAARDKFMDWVKGMSSALCQTAGTGLHAIGS